MPRAKVCFGLLLEISPTFLKQALELESAQIVKTSDIVHYVVVIGKLL